jgi:hypothetical protein
MSTSASTIERDAGGRFVPGQSGNPAGKAPGTRNRATALRELMAEGEDEVVARIVIDKAKAGDAVAARFVIGHLCPRPRVRTIALDLADGFTASNVVAAHDAVLRALFAGEIAPDEAEAITRVLDARKRALDAHGKEEYARKCNPDFPAMRPPQPSAFYDDEDEDDEDEDEDEDEVEPSPPGPFDRRSGGQDEGVRRAASTAGSSRNPYPEGEGAEKGAGAAPADLPPDRLHFTCIQQGQEAKSPVALPAHGSGWDSAPPPAAP